MAVHFNSVSSSARIYAGKTFKAGVQHRYDWQPLVSSDISSAVGSVVGCALGSCQRNARLRKPSQSLERGRPREVRLLTAASDLGALRHAICTAPPASPHAHHPQSRAGRSTSTQPARQSKVSIVTSAHCNRATAPCLAELQAETPCTSQRDVQKCSMLLLENRGLLPRNGCMRKAPVSPHAAAKNQQEAAAAQR